MNLPLPAPDAAFYADFKSLTQEVGKLGSSSQAVFEKAAGKASDDSALALWWGKSAHEKQMVALTTLQNNQATSMKAQELLKNISVEMDKTNVPDAIKDKIKKLTNTFVDKSDDEVLAASLASKTINKTEPVNSSTARIALDNVQDSVWRSADAHELEKSLNPRPYAFGEIDKPAISQKLSEQSALINSDTDKCSSLESKPINSPDRLDALNNLKHDVQNTEPNMTILSNQKWAADERRISILGSNVDANEQWDWVYTQSLKITDSAQIRSHIFSQARLETLEVNSDIKVLHNRLERNNHLAANLDLNKDTGPKKIAERQAIVKEAKDIQTGANAIPDASPFLYGSDSATFKW